MPWKEAVQLTVLKKQAARYPASIPMIAYCYGRGFMFEVGEVETAAAAVFDGSLVAVARRSPGLVVFGAARRERAILTETQTISHQREGQGSAYAGMEAAAGAG